MASGLQRPILTNLPEPTIESNAAVTPSLEDGRAYDIELTAMDTNRKRVDKRRRMLGDYSLGKTLGAGSMGKVKLATHTSGETVSYSHVTYLIPACRQDPAPCDPLSPSPRREPRSYSKAGTEGCVKGNSHHPRSSAVHASSPPVYMWHARDDCTPKSLLHGL